MDISTINRRFADLPDDFAFFSVLNVIVDVILLDEAIGALTARYALPSAECGCLLEVVARHRTRCTALHVH